MNPSIEPINTTNTLHRSSGPARLLIIIFLSLAIFLWPGFLERLIPLDWQVGDIRPVIYGFQGIFAVMTILCWWSNKKINAVYSKTFPTRRSLMLAIGLSCFCLLFCLIIAEFVFYIFDFPFAGAFTPSEVAVGRFDPELGWTYLPNLSVVKNVAGQEMTMHFNSIGARVGTPGRKFDPSAPTIILVGDSFTMGHGLSYQETVAGILEAVPDFPLQVVNLGVQGYGTDQALLLLKRYFQTFNTKAVVYGFICDHLKRNANYDRRHLHPKLKFLGTKPLFALRSDGKPYLSKLPHRYEELGYASRLWAAVQIVWAEYGPEPTPDLTRALVQEMRDYVSSHGATLVVLDWKWKRRKRCINDDYFHGMTLNLVNLADKAPLGWLKWTVPTDKTHPGMEANLYVTRRLLDELKGLNLLPSFREYRTPNVS